MHTVHSVMFDLHASLLPQHPNNQLIRYVFPIIVVNISHMKYTYMLCSAFIFFFCREKAKEGKIRLKISIFLYRAQVDFRLVVSLSPTFPQPPPIHCTLAHFDICFVVEQYFWILLGFFFFLLMCMHKMLVNRSCSGFEFFFSSLTKNYTYRAGSSLVIHHRVSWKV